MTATSGAAELEAYLDEENEAVDERWGVKDLIDADWALKRIADMQREISENNAIETAHIERLKLRTLTLNERAERGVRFFTEAVRTFAEAHRTQLCPGKKKSRALAHGSLGWRSVGGGLKVTDPEALLAWAKAQPPEAGVLRVKEEPAMASIKALFEATGEIPAGTEPAPKADEFHVKTIATMAEK